VSTSRSDTILISRLFKKAQCLDVRDRMTYSRRDVAAPVNVRFGRIRSEQHPEVLKAGKTKSPNSDAAVLGGSSLLGPGLKTL
jgi:hypothetical protein